MRTDSPSRNRGRGSILLDAIEFALFAAGFAALVLFAWWEIDARYHQEIYQRQIDEALAERRSPAISSGQARAPKPAATQEPATQGPFGRLLCPRIGLDVAILNGLDSTTLRRAAGRLPRNGENLVIAAHRDTYFRPLREIRKGDEITLEKIDGETRHYKVESIQVVDPSAVDWMRQTESPVLTLITCYPFNWIGPAPQRVIVRAAAS